MQRFHFRLPFVTAAAALWLMGSALVCKTAPGESTPAGSELKISYGANGMQSLVYGDQPLEDLSRFPADAFHIWHMKVTGLRGEVLPGAQYGWGENHDTRTWDSATKTWLYTFSWGSIRTQFVQAGNRLDIRVTETNRANSGVIFAGAVLYPLALHFPARPTTLPKDNSSLLTDNEATPGVAVADYGSGEVASVADGAKRPLYSGFSPQGSEGHAYTPLVASTAPDELAQFQPHHDRALKPGETDTFTVSLRFTASGTAPEVIARDAYESWARLRPAELHWTDRRVIGTVYLASSPQGRADQPGGYPNNPRRYFNNANASELDVRTPAGQAAFQNRVLQQARVTVENLTRLHAQGMIAWDMEGEEYPQSTSYVCAPDAIASIAPEMESVITTDSPFRGMRLDDAFFKIVTSAGFRVGVCVRPQHFTRNADGTAQQVSLPPADVAAELIRKMKFAHDRWGATLFYIDSTVDEHGAVLDTGIFQQAARALPDSLLIPEESTFAYYAYTAPFQSFLFHGDLGTAPSVRASYPRAFSVNLVNDVSAATLAAKAAELTGSVRAGDVLMLHADFWHGNNAAATEIYGAAAREPSATERPGQSQPPR